MSCSAEEISPRVYTVPGKHFLIKVCGVGLSKTKDNPRPVYCTTGDHRKAMRSISVAAAMVVSLIASRTVFAADYIDFARTTLLTCIHPTVNVNEAKAEYVQEPRTSGDITTSRIKVFYKGFMKPNAVVVEVYHRRTGNIEQMKANVLEDTAVTGPLSCKYVAGWQDMVH